MQAMMDLLRANSEALQRLEGLLAELRDANSTVAQQTIRLAEAFVRMVASLPPDDASAGGIEPVWQEVRQVRTSLQESQNRRVLETAVRFVLWTGRLRGRLDDESFMELALRSFPLAAKGKSREATPPGIAQVLAPVLHKQTVREPVLAAYDHEKKRRQALEQHVEDANLTSDTLRREIVQLQASLREIEEKNAQLVKDVAERDEQIRELSQDISDHRAVKRHTEKQLRARVTGLLNDDLLPLVRDIHDSASIEPVRTHIILDRADTALTLIQKESAWLKSSD